MTELREMPSSLNDACRKLDAAYTEIERLRAALDAARPYVWNGDSPGGCDGWHAECLHCGVIRQIDAALVHQQQ